MPSIPILTNTAEIYTYLDTAYQLPVDQDAATPASVVQIVQLTSKFLEYDSKY
jgi:hypothetical protein